LQRTLPHDKATRHPTAWYQPVPTDVADILRHNFGQGRLEYVAPQAHIAGKDYPRLYVIDARWMYASCVRDLPTGPCVHDDEPTYTPKVPGFYRVTFQAPANWRYPFGLLPVWDAEAEKTRWPTDAARWYEGWCGEPELRVAAACDWPFAVRERIYWPSPVRPDPVRGWVDRLVASREEVQGQPAAYGGFVSARLVAGAIRNLLVGAVGGWHRRAGIDEQQTPHELRHTIPAEAFDLRPLPSVRAPLVWRWKQHTPLSPDLAAFEHPEWAVSVWSRSRAREAAAAIKYTDQHWGAIAALRSDSLVVTAPPDWPDDGKPGTFRPKPAEGVGPLPDQKMITLPRTEWAWQGYWGALLRPRLEA
jgi:hypothetical protein